MSGLITRVKSIGLLCVLAALIPALKAQPHALVLQSDFGMKDAAVSAMKGVAFGIDPKLPIFDLTHEIPAYDIWEAGFRLRQGIPYWPEGTVFVSIVDPGVGTSRKSVVARTKNGRFIVGPDNGQLTLVADQIGLSALRQIDEAKHRLPGSEKSHTFHGRDLYVVVAAKLASGQMGFEQVGLEIPSGPKRLEYQKAVLEKKVLRGTIPTLDIQYGNVWTNIGEDLFQQLKPKMGERFRVTIRQKAAVIYQGEVPYAATFGDVPLGRSLLYINSLLDLSLALNQDSFSRKHHIGSGPEWSVEISRP